ncbi:MAG: cytochrome c [Flavobacterium sp.]|jgi:mono/diheme cytochrome c family protein|nr:cytochrome c [Flavobacterium sp.]
MKKFFLSVAALIITGSLISFKIPTTKMSNIVTIQDSNKGKAIYSKTCVACHQANGQGIPNAFPPLAKSDYLNKDVNRAIKIVLNGLNGPITVNGAKYNSAMTSQGLTDQQVADVLTYVYSSWGNNNSKVTPAMVKAQRGKK